MKSCKYISTSEGRIELLKPEYQVISLLKRSWKNYLIVVCQKMMDYGCSSAMHKVMSAHF